MNLAQNLTTIDISEYQGADALDWPAVVQAGIKSVIIRLSHGHTQDLNASAHIANAEKYGIIWHGYHYYEGTTGEVEFSTSNAQTLGLSKNAYMFLDMEGSIGGSWSDQFEDFRTVWLTAGWNVGLYCSDSPYQANFNNDTLVSENVYRWIAKYSTITPTNYDAWQMSGAGGGGIGTYTKDIDKDYDRTGRLAIDYTSNTGSGDGGNQTETGPYDPDVPTAGAYVGKNVDSSGLNGGKAYGYSTDGKNFYAVITPYGLIFRTVDGDRMWKLIKPKIGTIAGTPGADGKSAYDIWLANGHTGTVTDYLNSLIGLQGPQGNVGPQGIQGSKGDKGDPGAQGATGAQGSQGIAGIQGPKGDTGDQGLQGIQGPAGNTGLTGSPGPKGDTGDVGPQGDQGPIGLTGPTGDTGTQGPAGKNGVDGQDGLSAYQVAVNNGFTGTQAEWLTSLKGKDGVGGSGDGEISSLSVDAIMDVVGQHLNIHLDLTTGDLVSDNTDIDQDTLADAVASRVMPLITLKLTEPDLYAEIGGDN